MLSPFVIVHQLRRRQENDWLNLIVSSSNDAAAAEAVVHQQI